MKLAQNAAVRAITDVEPFALSAAPNQALERFFPGVFEILLPAVLSALPNVLGLFASRGESGPGKVSPTTEPHAEQSRFLPELLAILGPLLSAIAPVVIEQIQRANRDTATTDQFEAMEDMLPDLLGAVVPPLVRALRTSLDEATTNVEDLPASSGQHTLLVRSHSSGQFLGAIVQAILPAISAVLPKLLDLITGSSHDTSSREVGISLNSLTAGARQSDGDFIRARITPIDDPDGMEIALQLGGRVSWWKGIQLRSPNGDRINEIEANGSVNLSHLSLSGDEVDDLLTTGGSLAFGKAKFFGVHTWMYTLPIAALGDYRGKRITCRWISD